MSAQTTPPEMIAALTLLLTLASDPRLALVELLLAEQPAEALELADRRLAEQPEEAHRLGLLYLRGHLLSQLDDDHQSLSAARAFHMALGATPKLELHSRYRLALEQERLGHPEVAAGVVARVVSAGPPEPLASEAVRLFTRALAGGGDCRLLGAFDPDRLPDSHRRRLLIAFADCALARGDQERAVAIFLGLLGEPIRDEPERQAAERLAALPGAVTSTETATLVGLAFHQHRDFERAIGYLEPVVQGFGDSLRGRRFEIAYALVRSYFWMERFDQAAQGFDWLARRTPEGETRARALYQQARCFELQGKWRHAFESFRAAYRAEPEGRWADAALFSALRLKWRSEEEPDALKLYETLASRRSWGTMAARAALFLASSDLVRGRFERSELWLSEALGHDREVQIEVDYWRGRQAELTGRPEAAVTAYLAVVSRSPYHPLAQAARGRLALPGLDTAVLRRGQQLVASGRSADLYGAWLLLGSDSAIGRGALDRLRQRLAGDRFTAPFLQAEPVPPADWPLWRSSLESPEEMLLALGVFGPGAPAVGKHFPVSNPSLAVTGSLLLARGGQDRSSIGRLEVLARRIPDRLPEVLWPRSLRQLLYPLAHRRILRSQSERFGVDPLFLASIIREESRFDPRALSPASARGLTQFVQPTAQRVARRIGLGEIEPEDLYSPPLALTLGAAYLGELLENTGGATEMAVASYNAGEPQARLWRAYCFSLEPEEYYTKVSFKETRAYLTRVLSSYARYREIYAPPPVP